MKKYYLSENESKAAPRQVLMLNTDEYRVLQGLLVAANFDNAVRCHFNKKELKILDRLYIQI